jgi:hypothetical protein
MLNSFSHSKGGTNNEHILKQYAKYVIWIQNMSTDIEGEDKIKKEEHYFIMLFAKCG